MFFFDDQKDLETWGKVGILVDLIKQYFGDSVYTPVDYQKHGGFMSSIEEMLKIGKRVLFMSGSDYGAEMNSTIFYKTGPELCGWSEPGILDINFSNCSVKTGEGWVKTNTGKLFRPETSEIWYGPINGGDTNFLNTSNIPDVVKCGINFPSPDLITPKRMGAYVWSYLENEPANYNCSITRVTDGRWQGSLCSSVYYGACSNKSQTMGRRNWTLSLKATPFDSVVCPPNFEFSVPINPMENEELRLQLQQNKITNCWISI